MNGDSKGRRKRYPAAFPRKKRGKRYGRIKSDVQKRKLTIVKKSFKADSKRIH